jgi:acylphosphatase
MDALNGDRPLEERRFVITGRVQGVGFRWFVRECAQGLGVRGWVRNADDGSVIVEATADGPSLEQLAVRLGQGPPGARVEEVRAGPRTAAPPLPDGFHIVR